MRRSRGKGGGFISASAVPAAPGLVRPLAPRQQTFRTVASLPTRSEWWRRGWLVVLKRWRVGPIVQLVMMSKRWGVAAATESKGPEPGRGWGEGWREWREPGACRPPAGIRSEYSFARFACWLDICLASVCLSDFGITDSLDFFFSLFLLLLRRLLFFFFSLLFSEQPDKILVVWL